VQITGGRATGPPGLTYPLGCPTVAWVHAPVADPTANGRGPDAPGRSGRFTPLAVGGVAAAGVALIAAVDPSDGGFPVCLSRSALGIDCPLCGGLRCVNALVRGDVVAAVDHNVVLAALLPLAALAWAAWTFMRLSRRTVPPLPSPGPAVWIPTVVLLAAFTVGRNVGGDGWLAWLGSDLPGG
jgi:hypothetical protein